MNYFPFSSGQLSGNPLCALPSKMADGSDITGALGYRVTVDGEQVASKDNATTGDFISVPLTLERGTHDVMFIASVDGTDGLPVVKTQFFGSDNPCAPLNVALDTTTNILSWDAVSEGAHRGYVDPSAVTYSVLFDGTPILSQPTSETSVTAALPQDVKYGGHTFTVVALYDGFESEPAAADPIQFLIETIFAEEQSPLAIREYSLTGSNGVALLSNTSCMVYGTNGAININATEATDVDIYTLSGTLVRNIKGADGNLSIPAAPGMYIVRTPALTKKIMVK